MKIDSIDHIVLTVKDIQTTVQFYTEIMGMEAVAYGAESPESIIKTTLRYTHVSNRNLSWFQSPFKRWETLLKKQLS